MIKNILWDFDGVILDSMKIKANGFRELFKEYSNESLDRIEDYHYAHGGVSRFDKIKYFYNEILGKEISEDVVLCLANDFAKIIRSKLYDEKNLIKDSISFISDNYKKYNFHIVSGAEHDELNSICDFFYLSQYFITINGSPTRKNILVENILKRYKYIKDETILIGDAFTDYNASLKNGIDFYGYNNLEMVSKSKIYINSFNSVSL